MDRRRTSRYGSSSSSSDDEIERNPKQVVNAVLQANRVGHTGQSYKPPRYSAILEERHCTDVLFLLLFAAFWGGMATIAWYGYTRADLKRLEYGLDMKGNTCGTYNTQYNGSKGPDFTNRRDLYWLNPSEFLMDSNVNGHKAVCVASCPTNTNTYVCEYKGPNWDTDYYSNLSNFEKKSSREGAGPCYIVELPTTALLHKCFPKSATKFLSSSTNVTIKASKIKILAHITKLFKKERLQMHFADVKKGWAILVLCGLVGGSILSLLWIGVARICVAVLIWTTLIAINLALISITLFCFVKSGKSIALKFSREVALPSWMDPSSNDKKIFLYVGYAMCVITGLFLLFTIVIARRLKIAIGCIKVASNALACMPSLLWFPVFPFFMVIVLLAWWIPVTVLLFTTSTVEKHGDGSFKLVWSHTTHYLSAYHIFGLLWTWQFICGFSYLTIASSVAYYYWYQGNPPAKSSLLSSMQRTARYHLGTIAFGSLLVALVQLVRLIFSYINSKLKRLKTNMWVPSYLVGCIGCCLFVLERILKYINRNTYIMVAIKGTDYCKSASRGVSLLVANALRVVAVTVVGDVVIFLGKIVVGAGSGVCAFYMAGAKMYIDPDKSTYLSSPMLPVLLSSIIGFLLGHIFMQVYEMAIDTIFLCFCEDCEQHDGEPICAPDPLIHALGAFREK